MSEEVTTHQVKGVCGGVMMKGDWLEFHIDIGRQYPVKLSTKQEDVKAAGQAAGSQEAVWTYTERDGNPNPHKPGEFFKNRYLSKVEVGGTVDPALAGQQSTSNAPTSGANRGGGRPAGETRSIERQAVVKAALHLYPSSLLTTDAQWFDLIERVHVWVAEEKAETPKPQPQEAPTSYEKPDDDIPF
jgi:hypothetical protein